MYGCMANRENRGCGGNRGWGLGVGGYRGVYVLCMDVRQ
jgi:hypothetical protein